MDTQIDREGDSRPEAVEQLNIAANRVDSKPGIGSWNRRIWFPVKMLIGMGLSQLLLGSVLLLGWLYRLMQRATLKRWWQLSELNSQGRSFRDFALGGVHSQQHAYWPNFVLGQNGWPRAELRKAPGMFAKSGVVLGHLTRSFRQNLRLGLQGILTTWTLTLPGCLLWLFAWYDGWNNSFNKGYEQAAVGPVVFILGMFLFVGAMFYVPMAQARFASTGAWRSFFQFRLIWQLIREEWLGCLLLAGLYAAVAFPVNIIKTMPEFFPQMRPALESLSPEEAISFLKVYFFWTMLLVLPMLVLLRVLAARIYASGIVRCLRRGRMNEEDLGENEWEALQRLQLIATPEPVRHHVIVTIMAWIATRAGRITSTIVIGAFWFAFIFQILVSEFFNFHPFVGWLNQPFVQLPWFRYLPGL